MAQAENSLGWMDVAIVLGGLWLVYLIQIQSEPRPPVVKFLSEKQVDTFSSPPSRSDREAAEAYIAFLSSGGYFASFAKGEGGAYGWADNHTSQQRADEAALAGCVASSVRCTIVARIRPSEVTEFDGITLSATQARILDEFRGLPQRKAVALEDNGAWGAAWNHNTMFEASERAMAHCKYRHEQQTGQENQPNSCRLVTLP